MDFDWTKILNWRLLSGSHDFPGPDGGTCINEAAILAAGMPYRKVRSLRDFPECFCPMIGGAAIMINDNMADSERQTLAPLVVQLAGSRVDDATTVRRLEYLIKRVPPAFDATAADGFMRHVIAPALRILNWARETIEAGKPLEFSHHDAMARRAAEMIECHPYSRALSLFEELLAIGADQRTEPAPTREQAIERLNAARPARAASKREAAAAE